MFGDMKFGLFDRVRRDAGDRLARAVADLLPQLARRFGRLAITTTDLAVERRMDDAARRFEAEIAERADRAAAVFGELHYRLLRDDDPRTADDRPADGTDPGGPPVAGAKLELVGDDELAEQILAQDLAATVRDTLESAYPTYLARLAQMLGQDVDEEGSALTARGFAVAMVSSLRPFGTDPLLQEPLSESLRLLGAPLLAGLIEAADAMMADAGLLVDGPRIVIERSPERPVEPPLPPAHEGPRAAGPQPFEVPPQAAYDDGEPPVLVPEPRPSSPSRRRAAEPVSTSPAVAQAVNALLGGVRGANVLGIHPITGKRHPRAAFRQAELLPTVESIERDAVAFAHQTGTVPYSHDARVRFFGTLRESMRAAHVDDAQLATLDLVQSMFDYVNDDSRIPEPAKPLLWRLQMPSVTLAALDPGYLANDDHSMRSLVEHVAAISIAYPDEIVRDGELYRRMQTLVRAAEVVAHAFQVRSRVLSERVAIEYSRATYGMGQLVSRVVRERRELDATAGQPNRRDYRSRPSREREQQVTERINGLMAARLEGRNVPDSVRDFLKDVWVRHLRTRVLRDGEDSAGFKVALEVVDDLLWTLDGAGRRRSRRALAEKIPKILETLTQGIGDIGRRPEDFGPFFDEMFLIHLRRMQGRKSRRSADGDTVPEEGLGQDDTPLGDDELDAWLESVPTVHPGRGGRAAAAGPVGGHGDEDPIELGDVVSRYTSLERAGIDRASSDGDLARRPGEGRDPEEPPVLSDAMGGLPPAGAPVPPRVEMPALSAPVDEDATPTGARDTDWRTDPTTDQAAHRLAEYDTDIGLLDEAGDAEGNAAGGEAGAGASDRATDPAERRGRDSGMVAPTPSAMRQPDTGARVSAERSELKLRRLIDETSLDDAPASPTRVEIDPQQLVTNLQPGDWLQLVNSHRDLVLAKVAWINERRTVTLLLQHPDRLILSRHLSAIGNRARRGRVFLVR